MEIEENIAVEKIINIINVKKYFPVNSGLIFQKKIGDIKAVDDISFSVNKGETLGLVGESGCGKTTTGNTVMRLYQPTEGEVWFKGQNITNLQGSKLRRIRRDMQMIFQDPYSSLNRRMNIGDIIGEPLEVHGIEKGNKKVEKVKYLLNTVGLSSSFINRYPHEFSGGQRQRIGIARALAVNPEFIVLDEPVSALDVSIQAQIINLLMKLQDQLNLTYLFIAHDLSVVRHISTRVAVMYLGRIVELTDTVELYNNPKHPYTRALLSAVPIPDPELEESRERIILSGELPSPSNPPKGCVFHPRCPLNKKQICTDESPKLNDTGGKHFVSCHLV